MKKLYPLKFEPILKQVVWGGDSLVKKYGKQVPCDDEGNPQVDAAHIGESWEISDMEGHVSVVSNGFLKGNDLADILETYLGDLVGDNVFDFFNLQFPLLIKFLDIRDRLSVQVHPDDDTAMERYYSYGKTEMWYVMDAAPEAVVYMGFKRDTSAEEFYKACKDGTVKDLMNEYHPKAGDSFFIKAGTVHSAGFGLTIAEIQESSDITFRLYDWGRENDPATRREMFLEEAIDCIDYNRYDEESCLVRGGVGDYTLAQCRQFIVRSLAIDGKRSVDMDGIESMIIYMCTEGEAEFVTSDGEEPVRIKCGETVLIPASIDNLTVSPVTEGTRLMEAVIGHMDDVDGYFDE